MIDALQVVRYSLRDFWEEFVLLVVLNVLSSVALMLPVAAVYVLGRLNFIWSVTVSLLLALPLPIMFGALCFVTNQIAHGRAVGWGTYTTGLRRYCTKSLAVALINLIVLVLIAANVQFYALVLQGTWTNFAVGIWLIIGTYWLVVQVFWFPMILELENEKVLLALRNALAMVIITPGFSLTMVAIMVLLGALCIVLQVPAALIMVSLLQLMANHATRSRLAHVQKKPYRPGMDQH